MAAVLFAGSISSSAVLHCIAFAINSFVILFLLIGIIASFFNSYFSDIIYEIKIKVLTLMKKILK